jgi:lipid-A-disaccharide synthase-like uncharacterized protein
VETLQIYLLGFVAQMLFGCRLIIQWWQSEKSRSVVSPRIYWQLSLAGSFLFLWYGLIRADIVIIVGQALSYFIYIRNLQLKNAWKQFPLPIRILIFSLPFLSLGGAMLFFENTGTINNLHFMDPLMIVGAIGQLALNLRFVYQWHYSEKHKTSLLPFGFWSISTWASVLVIIYSLFHPVYQIEPVLLVSQTMGIVVYIRNMILSRQIQKQATM